MTRATLLIVVACAGVGACRSPEGTRTRGGGPGADVGNRSRVVKMHEGGDPYHRTPDRIPRLQHMPLDGAEQADRLSRE
jgi:hypothetical protein